MANSDAPSSSSEAPRVDLAGYSSGFSFAHRVVRGVWAVAWWCLFRPSPRPLFFWRRALLRCFGAQLGVNARVYPSAKVWLPSHLSMGDHSCLAFGVECYNVAPIRVGSHVTVSQYAYLCSAGHDISDPRLALTKAPIVLEDASWVCAGAFVAMGVTVGEGAVVAARACVTRDVQPWTIVGGNPARQIGTRELMQA